MSGKTSCINTNEVGFFGRVMYVFHPLGVMGLLQTKWKTPHPGYRSPASSCNLHLANSDAFSSGFRPRPTHASKKLLWIGVFCPAACVFWLLWCCRMHVVPMVLLATLVWSPRRSDKIWYPKEEPQPKATPPSTSWDPKPMRPGVPHWAVAHSPGAWWSARRPVPRPPWRFAAGAEEVGSWGMVWGFWMGFRWVLDGYGF